LAKVKSPEELAEEVLEQAEVEEELLRLSSGAVVRPLQLPELLLRDLYDRDPRPQPPIVHIEDKESGKSWNEENPDDPKYLQELQEWSGRMAEAVLNIILLRGLELVSLPEEAVPFEDESWVEELELFGQRVPERGPIRKLMWLKSQVVLSSDDLDRCQEACLARSGVTEEAVQRAMDRFQREISREPGSEDTGEVERVDDEPGV